MSNAVQTLASLLAAATMLVSNSANMAAPQNDFSGDLFLVNRQWRVSEYYVPVLREVKVTGAQDMVDRAATAYEEMAEACKKATGEKMIAVSGYRSFSKQKRLYSAKLSRVKTNEKADEYVARPGASEHQTGMAMDVGQAGKAVVTNAFRNTEVGKWMAANCWRYGFILRYGEDWERITGYKYESWHVRYVGKAVAKQIHENPVPFETWLISYRQQKLSSILGIEVK